MEEMDREKNNDEVRIPSSCHVDVSRLTRGWGGGREEKV